MPKIKIFLMTKNEIELLEDWIKYHGYLFGLDNIHVLDGSDDERIFAIYDKYKSLGLNVHFTNTGLNGLADELSQLMNTYKGSGNFLIKLDTDEFLAYTLPVYFSSHDLNINSNGNMSSPVGRTLENKEISVANFSAFFEKLPITGQRYKASYIVWSIPKHELVAKPCRDLTEFTSLQYTHLKSFFHSDSFVSVDLGSHEGTTSTNNNEFIDTGLTLFHYHSTSVEDSVRRARQVLISHEYISADDSILLQRDKLTRLRSRNVNSWHKIDLYLQYLDMLEKAERLNPEILNRQHPYFKQQKTCQISLVRDLLDLIDRECIYE